MEIKYLIIDLTMLKCKENIPSYYNTAKFKTHSMNTEYTKKICDAVSHTTGPISIKYLNLSIL